ncbi:TIGR02391 family protein [Pseudomonas sp. XS1P51]
MFRQELFGNAVFEAFKVLEVTIRQATGLGDEWIGTKLTNRAFHPKDGSLTIIWPSLANSWN